MLAHSVNTQREQGENRSAVAIVNCVIVMDVVKAVFMLHVNGPYFAL